MRDITPPRVIPANPAIRRRWLISIALFGPSGAAATNALQANRLIYEELVKLVLVLTVAALAAWLGVKTLLTRTFPPAGLRVPFPMSVYRGSSALLPGIGLLVAAIVTLGFRVASLRVTLELAGLLRRFN